MSDASSISVPEFEMGNRGAPELLLDLICDLRDARAELTRLRSLIEQHGIKTEDK